MTAKDEAEILHRAHCMPVSAARLSTTANRSHCKHIDHHYATIAELNCIRFIIISRNLRISSVRWDIDRIRPTTAHCTVNSALQSYTGRGRLFANWPEPAFATQILQYEAKRAVLGGTVSFVNHTIHSLECGAYDGGNQKFIHEFYPEIKDLTLERLNSQGEDSLTQVVLKGRAFMNPFEGRVSESEARALIRYMYELAEEK